MERLGGLCDFISGVTFNKAEAISSPLPGYLPILRAGNIGDALNTKDDFVWVPSDRVSDEQLLQVGDIVMCMSSGSPRVVGKSALLEEQFTGSAGAFCSIIRPKQEEQRKYLAYWFKSECFTRWRDSQARGVNIQNLRASQLKLVEIPLPPLPDQKRIAAILAKADRLRRLRRTARDLSDTYLQSVFLEMFGDPVSNPMGWERAKVSDLGKVQTGNTPSRSDPENYGSYIEWIKSDNIANDEMFVTRSREMLSEEGLRKGRSVEPGSILVTCIAGSPTSIGNIALTDRKVAFNQQINAVTPHKDVDSIFLYGLFRVAKPLVQRSTTLGMKRIITKSKFQKLVLIKPPLSLQQQFVHITHKFERLRTQQREAERQAEHLFQTLLHQAFRGEL